jgi:DNA polymerase-3 subunit alpha
MEEIEKVKKWCEENALQYEEPFLPNLWQIGGKTCYEAVAEGNHLLNGDGEIIAENVLFDKEFHFIRPTQLRKYDEDESIEIDLIFFDFAGKYYYISPNPDDRIKLRLFKYIGEADQITSPKDTGFAHLGIHGKYEVLNGLMDYDAWIEKAKFLGFESLGICERNTLAGTFSFYAKCKQNGIKPILGETVSVQFDKRIYDCKLYAISGLGWRNLLRISSTINSISEKIINYNDILALGEGLVFVFSYDFPLSKKIIDLFSKHFDAIFYQLDTVRWQSKEFDEEYVIKIVTGKQILIPLQGPKYHYN